MMNETRRFRAAFVAYAVFFGPLLFFGPLFIKAYSETARAMPEEFWVFGSMAFGMLTSPVIFFFYDLEPPGLRGFFRLLAKRLSCLKNIALAFLQPKGKRPR